MKKGQRVPIRDKREFIYKYATNFAILSRFKWFPKTTDAPEHVRIQIRYLAQMARKELGFSEKTGNGDIVYSLQGEYLDMFKAKLIG